MKTSTKYESLARVLALLGAISLGCAGFPCLNPIQFKLLFGEDTTGMVELIYVVSSLPVALATLLTAWYFTDKATRLKREEQNEDRAEKRND